MLITEVSFFKIHIIMIVRPSTPRFSCSFFNFYMHISSCVCNVPFPFHSSWFVTHYLK